MSKFPSSITTQWQRVWTLEPTGSSPRPAASYLYGFTSLSLSFPTSKMEMIVLTSQGLKRVDVGKSIKSEACHC